MPNDDTPDGNDERPIPLHSIKGTRRGPARISPADREPSARDLRARIRRTQLAILAAMEEAAREGDLFAVGEAAAALTELRMFQPPAE